MSVAIAEVVDWKGLKVVNEFSPEFDQRDRIIEALGPLGERPPSVDEETLSRYYEYLTANLSFPFVAYYPEPTDAFDAADFRCTVLELLDPAEYLSGEFDGIFCKTRRGDFEVNLPLVELKVPETSPNHQLIEDYWYWFWYWRS